MVTAAIITAIAGYAIGTVQVVALDWFRARRSHAKDLRLLKAELERARIRDRKFEWPRGEFPSSDKIPEPPVVTDLFAATVSRIDFYITDEYIGDNTQVALLHLLDGLGQLRHYRAAVLEHLDEARVADGDRRKQCVERLYAYAAQYDELLEVVLYQIDSALVDVGRRLREVATLKQLRRLWTHLPEGAPPPPVKPGDPRLKKWRDGGGV